MMFTKVQTATIFAGAAAAVAVFFAPTAAAGTSCVLPPDADNSGGTPCVPTPNSYGSDQVQVQAPQQFALGGLHHEQ
jgi:hypothetical protein